MILLYIKYFGVFLLGATLLICLFWVGCFLVDAYRYRKAIDRRVKEIDREMQKRGGMF